MNGIYFAIAKDIHLPVTEDFAWGGIVISRYVFYGGSRNELRLERDIINHGK